MSTSYVTQDLFGGAITAEAPEGLLDASNLRQVPDTQEVLLYPHHDVSIIVELLETVGVSEDKGAIEFHFHSLAHDNESEEAKIHHTDVVPNARGDTTPSAIILRGTQLVKKFNRTVADTVTILMALYRVKEKNVDLVITFNIPLETESGERVPEADLLQATQDFHKFVGSLKIVDFSLFV